MTHGCLSRETLEALLDDRLIEPERTTAATHFSTCKICQQATETFYAAFGVDRIPQQVSNTDEDPADLHSFLQQLKQIPPVKIESLRQEYSPGDESRVSSEAETVATGASLVDGDRNDDGTVVDHSDPLLRTEIGPYRLIERLGVGGFGIVYRAQQDYPIRLTVALKVIKPGMDSREVIARFQTERQALALMDHPHIARVLNAGTTLDGRPYFVMELVNGLPLTDYCNRSRLTIAQRLKLLVTVCEAVQHAHQKGIIHRDLKPSNILVADRNGVTDVKVIDFGIAKALTPLHAEGTTMTSAGQMIGTLLYMAPEQIGTAGIDIDTRCDVYSLGVLLFELLTGTTPFERERLKALNQWESLRIIREEEPPRASARLKARADIIQSIAVHRATSPRELVRQVRSDLDWIAMKALEKDRNRRYPTTIALAAEISRVLNHEPVEACPPTTTYLVRKFVRRNMATLATLALVLMALVGGTAIATWQAYRAEFHREEAAKTSNTNLALRYAAEFKLATTRLLSGDYEQTEEILNRWVPQSGEKDLRGIEWHLLKERMHVPGDELMKLASPKRDDGTVIHDVSCVRLSPDAAYVVAATDGGIVRRVDLKGNQELPSWEANLNDVRRLAFSRDGRWLALISYEAEAVVIETATGAVRHRFPKPEKSVGPPDVEFFDDATLLATGQGPLVKVWDIETGQLRMDWVVKHCREIFDCGVSPGFPGIVVGTVGDRIPGINSLPAIEFFAEPNGSELRPWIPLPLAARTLAVSHDGNLVATGNTDGRVAIWDWRTVITVADLVHTEKFTEISFSNDDELVALTDATGMAHVWPWRAPESTRINFRGKIQSVVSDRHDNLIVQTASGQVFSISPEIQVHTHTSDQQWPNGVAMNSVGDFVIGWMSRNQDGSSDGVFAQQFHASGAAVRRGFQVNAHSAGNQRRASVAFSNDRNSIFTWSSGGQDGDGEGVYARLFNSEGLPTSSEFLVNADIVAGDQQHPKVKMGANGNFVIVWASTGEQGDAVYGQRYNGAAMPIGHNFLITQESIRNRVQPGLAMDPAGNFVVTWMQSIGEEDVVYARKYAASGMPLGDPFQIHKGPTTANVWSDVAMSSQGSFVIVWTGSTGDGTEPNIYARLYHADAIPHGPAFLVNTHTNGKQEHPAVAMAANGEFIISWDSKDQDGSGDGVYAQRFHATGEKMGREFRVNSRTKSHQRQSRLAMSDDGQFVITWASNGQDGSGFGVYARLPLVDEMRRELLKKAVATQSVVQIIQDQRGSVNVQLFDDAVAADPVPANSELDQKPGTRRFAPDHRQVFRWQAHPRPARSIVFSPDSRTVITAGKDGRIVRWRWDQLSECQIPGSSVKASLFTRLITWLPKQDVVVIAHGPRMNWHGARNGELLTSSAALNTDCCEVVGDTTGRWTVAREAVGPLKLWTYPHNDAVVLPDSETFPEQLTFIADSPLLFGIDFKRRAVKCWDVEVCQLKSSWELNTRGEPRVVINPLTKVVHILADNEYRRCDLLSGAERLRYPLALPPGVSRAAISPDDKYLALGRGRQIDLIDTDTGQVKGVITGYQGKVSQLEFDFSGNTLLALDDKGVLKLWQASHGSELFTFGSAKFVYGFSVSPDGHRLAIVYDAETAILELAPLTGYQ